MAKRDLGKAQEDQAEDRAGVLLRLEAGVGAELVCRVPQALFQRTRGGILFARRNPMHETSPPTDHTPSLPLGLPPDSVEYKGIKGSHTRRDSVISPVKSGRCLWRVRSRNCARLVLASAERSTAACGSSAALLARIT